MTVEDAGLSRRGLLGIALVAFAVLVVQVALTRILSVVMWYHFAFVAISLAMLGLAVSGILLYLVPPLVRLAPVLVPWCCRLAGVSTVGMLLYVAHTPIRIEVATQVFSADVAILYLVALAPFLFAGFAISAALSHYARQISSFCFADLVGGGLGCIAVVGLLDVVGAPATILVAAAVFFLGSLALRRAPSPALDTLLILLAVGCAVWAFQAQDSQGPASPEDRRYPFEPAYQKGVADWEGALRPLFLGWNSHSRIKVYEPNGTSDLPAPARVIDIDGNARTDMVRQDAPITPEVIDRNRNAWRTWVGATPYAVLPPNPKALIIGPGGGRDVLAGLASGARITAVEINGLIVDLMTKGPFAQWSGRIYDVPEVTLVHDEARSWVRRTEERFDLIQATFVDTWAATASGAFALAENALYTREAFADFYDHLTDDGIVHLTRWHRDPPRESLRAVVLMIEVMRDKRIANPERRILVARDAQGYLAGSEPYSVILWSKREFTEEQIGKFTQFAKWREEQDGRLTLVPSYVAGLPVTDAIGQYLTHSDRNKFIDSYAYDIRPTTDDRPFFFNTVRLSDVARFKTERYENEQAVVVLVTVLLVVVGIVFAAFLLPFGFTLARIRRASGPGTFQALLYFCAIGVGFMLVEIPVLQRFGLYLGHPVYALSTVLASLLVGVGVGSALGGWSFRRGPVRGARFGIVLVIVAIAAIVLVLPQVFAYTLAMPLLWRIGVTVALLVPLGVMMGFPLPLGIRALESGRGALVPWAWGLNGAASVLASILGVAIGLYAGFTVAILTGAAFYTLALTVAGKLPGAVRPQPAPVLQAPTAPSPPEPPPETP